MVSPIDYRFSRKRRDYSSTTFGVRDVNNVWSFYTQRYAVTLLSQPKESVLKEVKWLF